MATIFLRRRFTYANRVKHYLSLERVVDMKPGERVRLNLEAQEYNIIAGDIAADGSAALAKIRREWRKAGHTLIVKRAADA